MHTYINFKGLVKFIRRHYYNLCRLLPLRTTTTTTTIRKKKKKNKNTTATYPLHTLKC